MADNDIEGAVAAVKHVLESPEWAEFLVLLNVRFTNFEELGLPRDAPDELVWKTCQSAEVVLMTANRAGGAGSLDSVIRESSNPRSLPVMTLADPSATASRF